ncbi:MAG TPA: thioredoxin domain-containing protein [Candidatus Limnocylindria bacterium]|nr:thioredoxin domain-containing protein [Candidatus Limnocylindria bacterium]
MNKRFLLILVGIVVIFGGLLVFNKREADAPTENGGGTAQLSEHKEEGSTGVILTEYGDFECPACGQFYPLIKQLKQQYKGRVTFQFRHFPLTEIHQNALISARAAEAAAVQGKFFEMHDKLYEGQASWKASANPASIFEAYAKDLGLDIPKFQQDMKSEKTNDVVQADRAEARKQGYQSTPTFILDGKKIENPTTMEAFTKLLDDAIKAKQKS